MTKTMQESATQIPFEVAQFATEQGVAAELPKVLEMTRQLFPLATIKVALEEDPEIPKDQYIVIQVQALRLAVAEALEARWQWHRHLFACCPARWVNVFCLALELET